MDLIDRQAAITIPVTPKEDREYQTFNLDDAYEQAWDDLQKRIEQLPSAQVKLDENDMPEQGDSAKFGVKTGETCTDCISRQVAIDAMKELCENYTRTTSTKHPHINFVIEELEALPSAQRAGRWIPVTARPMDNEERLEWSEKLGYDIEYNEALIYTSQLPDDGQEVLTCDRYGNVKIDTFESDPDYGCYFDENGDMDGIVAWMPLPKPYKEVK